MTTIGPATVDWPSNYRYGDYAVTLSGGVDRDEDLHGIRELFAKSRVGTAVHDVPGSRPRGEDLNGDRVNTQYVTFTHGDRPVSGWYLLRGCSFFQDESPRGADEVVYLVALELFFVGTTGEYQPGFAVRSQQDVTNDWGM